MSRESKFNKRVERKVLSVLDRLGRVHGLREVRHACNKWVTAMRERASLAKQKAELRRKLIDVNRRLRG